MSLFNITSQNAADELFSKGPWVHNKSILKKLAYEQTDKVGKFELMVKMFNKAAESPTFINWEEKAKEYPGWHLIYSGSGTY